MLSNDVLLNELLPMAHQRGLTLLREGAPFLAEQVEVWWQSLAISPRPADYFSAPYRFPYLLLPWWLTQTIRPQPVLAFQADVIYASLQRHYYELVMVTTEMPTVRPAATFFLAQCQLAYYRHFSAVHPFWDRFTYLGLHTAEAEAHTIALPVVTLEMFRRYTSQRYSPIRIPLAAVCYHYGRLDLLEAWSRCAEALGAWHQLYDEARNWQTDRRKGRRTYFLAEMDQRRGAEPEGAWMAREGLAWGRVRLRDWLGEVRKLAEPLQSPALLAYLECCTQQITIL